MATDLSNKTPQIENFANCLSCEAKYDENKQTPKVLPCGNTICMQCIEESEGRINCKSCQQEHFVSAKTLPTNNLIVDILKKMSQPKPKNVCFLSLSPKPASSYGRQASVWAVDAANVYDNIADPQYNTYRCLETNDLLEKYMSDVDAKLGVLNSSLETGKRKIEADVEAVQREVAGAAQELVDKIEKQKFVMLDDLAGIRKELLNAYTPANQAFVEFQKDCNQRFERIREAVQKITNRDSIDSIGPMTMLIGKLENLNAKILDNQKLIPDPNPKVGVVFTKSDSKINMPFIGDLNYDCAHRVDIVTKIIHFNNNFQQRLIDLSALFEELNPINHAIDLISKNKILIMFEKIYGKVKMTTLQVVYSDRTLLYQVQVKNVGIYVTHAVYDKHLVIAFKRAKKDVIIHVYELHGLRLVKCHPINYEITQIIINENKYKRVMVYLIAEKKPLINEFDIELVYKRSFGQQSKPSVPFYVKGELLTLHSDKIFVKSQEKLVIINQETGLLICSFEIPDIKICQVIVDFAKEKYLVYNKFNKLSYYNHKGELQQDNKIRFNSVVFDTFKYSITGHFAFLNADKNLVLVV